MWSAFSDFETSIKEDLLAELTSVSQTSPQFMICCIEGLLQVVELVSKTFIVPLSVDFRGMNEAHKRMICEGIISHANAQVRYDSFVMQIIDDLSVNVDDLQRDVTELKKQLIVGPSYGRIAKVFQNRLEIELNKHEFFNTDERQLNVYSMKDYHLMFSCHNRKTEGGEKFNQPQAQAYALFLSTAFPDRFGDKKMLLEGLSRRVAYLFAGILELTGSVAYEDNVSAEEAEMEVNQLKQEDIKGLSKQLKVKDIQDLFRALKLVHKSVGAEPALLMTMMRIEYPQLAFSRSEFDE